MTTRMTVNGISTCQAAGTEKYEKFSFSHKPRKTYIQYDYRDVDGTLFSIVRPTWKSAEPSVTNGCWRNERRNRNELFAKLYAG